MKIMANTTNTSYDLERFSDGNDIKDFIRKNHLDGFELLPYGENTLGIIPSDMIVGVHLSYYNTWVDFWNGNEEGVLAEFGDWSTAQKALGADKKALVDRYRAQLDFAEHLGAEYVVFHVADVSIAESVSYIFNHTDTQVIDSAIELINEIMEGRHNTLKFLVENLWWPGFTMTNPDMTRRLLKGICYENKGIMLDIGHLLHTNNQIESGDEGLKYIREMLDAHGELCGYIKGIHLHQSYSGAYVQSLIANPPALEGTYDERLGKVLKHIFTIDTHRPFLASGIRELIDHINPEFLTYEFITCDRTEHERFLTLQNEALDFHIK